jgi:sugar diacid utilization regulator
MVSAATSSETAGLRAAVVALQSQNAALRQLVSIHDRLGGLVLQGADVAAITRMLSDLVGRRVLLLDALLQVVAMAPASEEFRFSPRQGYVRAVLATLARERRPLRVPPMVDFGVDASCVLAPVAVGDAILGYLAILAEGGEAGGDDLDLQIVQHAANAYALSMMRERMAAEVSRQLKDELFEGLLLGRTQDEQVARERAMRLGYDAGVSYRVMVVTVSTSEGGSDRPETVAQRRRLLESLAELCARRSPAALSTVRDDELVVLVPEPDSAQELGRVAVQHAAGLVPDWTVTCAVGGPCPSATAIARSYAQAHRALETGQRFGHQGDGKVIAFEDLGVYRLLFHVTDPLELRGFTDQVLGELIEYDQRHNADLVRTLGTFLERNGNLQATARDLSLHVNSVAYRMQRIQSIAGLDLERSEDRLLAQVALKILRGVSA